MEEPLSNLEEHLGYKFRNQELLRTALTHSSYLNENEAVGDDNQRLEYLGDAIVDLIVAELLFNQFETAREGEMTRWRAQLVSTSALAHIAQSIDLDAHIILGRGEEATGGRKKAANLAAAMEALVAAVYLDSSWEKTRAIMLPLFKPYMEQVTAYTGPRDARSRLQEEIQASLGVTPRYRTVDERGPDHNRVFTVQVEVCEEIWGKGEGASKRIAAQAAARQALQTFERRKQRGHLKE